MWNSRIPPQGMTRRHFMSHMAGASAMAGTAAMFGHSLTTHAAQLERSQKSCILLWMGGGPSTIDIWDMKPNASTGGPFRPISTSGDVEICEHMPMMAQQMHHMSIIRSMSTREADHDRGRYYMHTGFVPNPNIEHPSYGSVVARELAEQRAQLEIPPFVAIGGASEGPGFLGMSYAPFTVSSNGRIRNLEMGVENDRLLQRMQALSMLESNFESQNRGSIATDHKNVLKKTFDLMTSSQMEAFNVDSEPDDVKERYGQNGFGQGCLLARRLVESGVPFVEVDLGGWDNHQNIHQTLETNKLPTLDRAMSALISDLEQRGRLQDTAIVWMGEFGRTPRINGDAGRDHFARAWSVVVGGAGMNGGIAIGETNEDGTAVASQAYSSEDLMASICKSLGISLETSYQSRSGRPMKIAGGGVPIEQLFS